MANMVPGHYERMHSHNNEKKNFPWLTKQLTKVTKKRDLFQKAKRSNSNTDYEKYKRCRNKVTNMLRNASI